MTRSILKGHVLVAIIEGLLGGIALFIAGVPGAAFWTFIMIIMSFIPVIGAFVVWLPAAIYMLVFVDPLRGIFILVYGFTIVSPSDSLLRPYLVDKKAGIHPAAVLIGVLGGVYVFGAIGLFIGPIILGFTKTMVEVVMNEY
jgi:predicted PurR-regulated permease PerM